jgi:biopolymer transport protein ExbB
MYPMKKIVILLSVVAMVLFSNNVMFAEGDSATAETTDTTTVAQTDSTTTTAVETTKTTDTADAVAADTEATTEAPEGAGLNYQIKQKFIEGGAGFMGTILLALIFGLALSIERILYLNFASINASKFVEQVEETLTNDGVAAAKELCQNTRGSIASIYYQGFSRLEEGNDIDMIEKSAVAYGSVQMGLMEKGLSWISLFIALAPMLGFMGTVIGMIGAFDSIQAAGDISPALVAGGIKVALITTVSGLIAAIILQIFYNYIVAKIDSLVNDMENSTISLIDMIVKYQNK